MVINPALGQFFFANKCLWISTVTEHELTLPLRAASADILKKKPTTTHEHTTENRREPPPSAHLETLRDQSSPCASRCFSLH